ncbi:MAG: ATP-binding protein, partial [Pirellulales bacterium]
MIGNAIKFTHTGGVRLRIWVSNENRRDGTIHFEVTDTGIGMSKPQIERIFKPFEQADTTTSRLYGGTGLGLSISRELVRMLGGEMHVTSEEGRGTTFTFTVDNDPDRITHDERSAALPAASQPV